MTGPDPQIHVRKDGPFYRVQVLPPEALGKMLQRPDSYASDVTARMAAKVLAGITGWPIVDLTRPAK